MFELPSPIPEPWFFTVESLILVFVFLEFVVSIAAFVLAAMSYKIATRKRGRPKKTSVERLMTRLSKQLKKSIALNEES